MDIKELKDTAELMCSKDYKDRFVAEYFQLKIRYEKLKKMLDDWDKGTLSFTPTCSRSMYDIQLKAMRTYLGVLASRAKQEKVDIDVEVVE